MATARVTIDALRELVAMIEAKVGTQVSKLDTEIGTTAETNTTLSTQLTEAFLLLRSQRDLMETHERAFEERMETLCDKVLAVTVEFQEQTRSLEGEIVSEQWCRGHYLPRIRLLQRCECLSPSLLVVREMPKTWRTSFGTWSNILLLPEYLLVNK